MLCYHVSGRTCLQTKARAVSDHRQPGGDRKSEVGQEREQIDGRVVGKDADSESIIQTKSAVNHIHCRRDARTPSVCTSAHARIAC